MLPRRGVLLVTRLGLHVAAEAGGSSSSTWAPHSAAALQLLDRWQQSSGGSGSSGGQQGSGAWQHQHMSVRHLSLWPGGRGNKQAAADQQPDSLAAAGEDFGSTASGMQAAFDATSSSSSSWAASAADGGSGVAAAAAGGTPGVADLFAPAAIVAAAAGAEADALSAAREESWPVTRLIQFVLRGVHDATGLEWWQSIALVTLGLRISTLPLTVLQVKNTYRMSQARPEVEALVNQMKEEQARGDPQAVMEYQQRVAQVWHKYNCNPFKSLLTIAVQAPIFFGFFSALRGFALHKVPSMTEGGTLWFTDLTAADPTYMLPVLAGLSFLATVELGAADGMQGQPPEMQKKMKNMMRGVALLVPLISATLPASVFVYWTASNIFSLSQASLLKIPAVKRMLGLPDLSKLRPQPSPAEVVGKPVQTFTYPTRPRKLKKAEAVE